MDTPATSEGAKSLIQLRIDAAIFATEAQGLAASAPDEFRADATRLAVRAREQLRQIDKQLAELQP